MKVKFEFPSVMKMLFSIIIDIPESISLKDLKQKVLDAFWNTWQTKLYPHIAHGAIQDFTLQAKEIKILSDDTLRKTLKCTTCFQVVFKEHTLIR